MGAPRKYSVELQQRATRMAVEARGLKGQGTWQAVKALALLSGAQRLLT